MSDNLPGTIIVAVALGLAGLTVVGVWLYCMAVALIRARLAPGPGVLRAAFTEVPASLRVAWWRMQGRAGARRHGVVPIVSDSQDTLAGSDVVVVLVHGAYADSTCLNGWAQAIVDAGVEAPVVAPDHGANVTALVTHAQRLRDQLHHLVALAPRTRLLFVAHSMGGLVTRRVLADDDDLRARAIGAITVATPHGGTQLARSFPLRPLRHLGFAHPDFDGLPALATLVPRFAFYASDVDAIVYPTSTALPHLTAADLEGDGGVLIDEVIRGVGHGALLSHPTATQKVAAAVQRLLSAHGHRS